MLNETVISYQCDNATHVVIMEGTQAYLATYCRSLKEAYKLLSNHRMLGFDSRIIEL